jgi:RND family efflux transporter MFP subunit
MVGVRTAPIERRGLSSTIRTVGSLAYDETRVAQIHTKIAGWIEKVFVDYEGKVVARGEPLFTVYSPELVSAQREYLLALRAQEVLEGGVLGLGLAANQTLASVAHDRLRLWDVSEAQIAALRRTGEPARTLTLFSPFDGVVVERNTFPGQYVTPETATFKVADLSRVWVIGEIFEYELPRIRLGQEVEIDFPYGQSKSPLQGRITYIYPAVQMQTRRVRIRAEFANPGLEFKPGSYVTVVMRSEQEPALVIPKEAVIDTGVKRYALLSHPGGYFEPREIQVGEPVDDVYPLLGGLSEGEPVVVSAQFLIDSETNLQAAMQSMAMAMPGMDMGGGQQPEEPAPGAARPPDHGGHGGSQEAEKP